MISGPKVSPDKLTSGSCEPCEGGVDPMTRDEMQPYLDSVPEWERTQKEGVDWIVREVTGKDFVDVVELVDDIADIAEAEGHHPNLYLYSYKQLRIELSTHAIDGLSVNDFIVAAKIDELLADQYD